MPSPPPRPRYQAEIVSIPVRELGFLMPAGADIVTRGAQGVSIPVRELGFLMRDRPRARSCIARASTRFQSLLGSWGF